MRSSLPVTVEVLPPPDDFVPPNDMQGLLDIIPSYLDIELDDTGPTIGVGASPPADNTGLWVNVQPAPTPPQLMVFNPAVAAQGGWEQVYNGQPVEVRMFVGDPTGIFDATGLAGLGTSWQGWALCNGQNGTIDVRNKFVVPGYKYDPYNQNWVTNIGSQQDAGGGQVGGSAQVGTTPINLHKGGFTQFQINLWNLPQLKVVIPFNGDYASGGTSLGAPVGPGTGNQTVTIPFTNQSQMVNALLTRLPPFIAVGFAQFVGY